MAVRLSHDDLHINGTVYGLSHLTSFNAVSKNIADETQNLSVRVSFSCHSYSKVPADGEIGYTIIDEAGDARLFCLTRYNDGLIIADKCRSMIENNEIVFESKDKNHHNNLAIVGNPLQDGNKYHIYFELFPSKADGIHVEVAVVSGYTKTHLARNYPRRLNIKSEIKRCFFNKCRVPKA